MSLPLFALAWLIVAFIVGMALGAVIKRGAE